MELSQILVLVILIVLAFLYFIGNRLLAVKDKLTKLEEDTNSSLQYIRNDIKQLQLAYEDTRKRLEGSIECSTNKYSWTREKVDKIEENRKLLTDLIYDLGYELDVIGPQPARPAHFKLKKPEQKRVKNAKS